MHPCRTARHLGTHPVVIRVRFKKTRSLELREEFPGGEAWGENQQVENQTTPNSAWEDEDQPFLAVFLVKLF